MATSPIIPLKPPGLSFAAFRHAQFRWFFCTYVLAMMADNIEHVISYWMMFQQFHSPALGGFAVLSHWLPFLFFSVPMGALADRVDPRRLIQLGMLMFISVSLGWGYFFITNSLHIWQAMLLLVVHGCAGVFWQTASQLLLHEVVPKQDLQSGVRLSASGRSIQQPQPQRLLSGVMPGTNSMMPSPPLPQLPPPPALTPAQLQLLAQIQHQHQQHQQQHQQQQQQTLSYSPPQSSRPIQPKPVFPTAASISSLGSPPTNSSFAVPSSSAAAAAAAASTTPSQQAVELGSVLLSFLSSSDLQRGLLHVNRLWRFRCLLILQSRQVNIQVQIAHLHLGPFRPASLLDLVFSSQLTQRRRQPEPARLQAAAVTTAGAATASLPYSSIARATVCAPMPLSALVKAKEVSGLKSEHAGAAPAAVLHHGLTAHRHLSKKKLREAALLAESRYNSIIECGIVTSDPAASGPSSSPLSGPTRLFRVYSPFFGKEVEVYTALTDPQRLPLYRASALADKYLYATNKVGMYLSRRRLHSGGGIYQATGFQCKPAGRTGLKCGGYFLTIDACKEFENHFLYGGLTEEQRREKAAGGAAPTPGSSSAAASGAKAEIDSDDEGEDSETRKGKQGSDCVAPFGIIAALDPPSFLSSVSSSASSSSPLSGSSKRRLDDGEDGSGGIDGLSASSPSSFKRIRSDYSASGSDRSAAASPGGGESGGESSDGGTGLSVTSLGKNVSDSGSGSDGEDVQHSPAQSTRSSQSSVSDSSQRSASHRSAFKAPTAHRQSSFTAVGLASTPQLHQQLSTSPALVTSTSASTDSSSPQPSVRDGSPLRSPSQQLSMMPPFASLQPMSQSAAYSAPASYSLNRLSSFAPSQLFSPPPAPYLSNALPASPPLAVRQTFNAAPALPLSHPSFSSPPRQQTAAAPAPVVPLSHPQQLNSGLEAAFTSALLQRPAANVGLSGTAGSGGGDVVMGANGLLSINNLTLSQLQALLGVAGGASGGQALLNLMLMQGQQQQQPQYGQ